MKIEVNPVTDCHDCIFCYDGNWCNLVGGDHCDFDYDNGRHIASWCPLVSKDGKSKVDEKYHNIKVIDESDR